MPRSPGFGSNPTYSFALFRLAFATPPPNGLSLHVRLSRGPIIQKVRCHIVKMLQLIVSVRFQVCFTPLIGVLFTFPSRYLCTIGQSGVFSLGGWAPHIQTGLHVSRPTQGLLKFLPVRDYHPLWCAFPKHFQLLINSHWADPRSLATTSGISVDFFSSGYLDVSVPRVSFTIPMYSV